MRGVEHRPMPSRVKGKPSLVKSKEDLVEIAKVDFPESVLEQARTLAQREGMTLEEFLSYAVTEGMVLMVREELERTRDPRRCCELHDWISDIRRLNLKVTQIA